LDVKDPQRPTYVGSVVATIDAPHTRNSRLVECQYLTELTHYDKTDENPARTVAKGKGFDPDKDDGSLIDVTIDVSDIERYMFTLLKVMFCFLKEGESRRKVLGLDSLVEPLRILKSDAELFKECVEGDGGN